MMTYILKDACCFQSSNSISLNTTNGVHPRRRSYGICTILYVMNQVWHVPFFKSVVLEYPVILILPPVVYDFIFDTKEYGFSSSEAGLLYSHMKECSPPNHHHLLSSVALFHVRSDLERRYVVSFLSLITVHPARFLVAHRSPNCPRIQKRE
jgi:hypothetical protein